MGVYGLMLLERRVMALFNGDYLVSVDDLLCFAGLRMMRVCETRQARGYVEGIVPRGAAPGPLSVDLMWVLRLLTR